MSESKTIGSFRKVINVIGAIVVVFAGVFVIADGGAWGAILVLIGGFPLVRYFLAWIDQDEASPQNSYPDAKQLQPSDNASSLASPIVKSDQNQTVAPSEESSGLRKKVVTVGGIILVLVVIFFGRIVGEVAREYLSFLNTDGGAANYQEFWSGSEPREYVASDHGFRVTFPGFPTKETDVLDLDGHQLPYALYSRENNSGQAFAAMVWDYESVPIESSDLDLEGALNGAAQNINGTLLQVSESQLGNNSGLEGHIWVSDETASQWVYARVTARGKQMYGVMTFGVAQADFQRFASSFKFD